MAGAALKPSGALARRSGSQALARIAAWGQTSTHLPHWMQSDSSHTPGWPPFLQSLGHALSKYGREAVRCVTQGICGMRGHEMLTCYTSMPRKWRGCGDMS
jgi:hypothetical protein